MTDTEETKTRKPRTTAVDKAILSASKKLIAARVAHIARMNKVIAAFEAKRDDILAPFSEDVRKSILEDEFNFVSEQDGAEQDDMQPGDAES